MSWWTRIAIAAAAVGSCFAVLAAGGRVGFAHGSRAARDESAHTTAAGLAVRKREARRVAARFLGALDSGRYDTACGLLARGFYRRNHIPDRKRCAVGLAVGLNGARVRFRIVRIDLRAAGAVVHARANGTSGVVRLVREHGVLKVLSLTGGRG